MRLTARFPDGRAYRVPMSTNRTLSMYKVIEKLADYEDAEEKGEKRIKEYDFQNNFKKLLKKRKITQSELARKSGVSLMAISKYCNTITEPSASRIVALAKALDVSTDELLLKRKD